MANDLTVIFPHLGSTCLKAPRKMLMKLTPGPKSLYPDSFTNKWRHLWRWCHVFFRFDVTQSVDDGKKSDSDSDDDDDSTDQDKGPEMIIQVRSNYLFENNF